MFDSTKQFEIPTIDGKRCTVRFPSDLEWCDRSRKHKIIQRPIGRGKSQLDTSSLKRVDAELFEKIRIDKDGPEFDRAEAAYVIDRLDRAQVVELERSGYEYTITLKVPGAVTTITLKVPSQAAVEEFDERSEKRSFGNRQIDIVRPLEPAGPLFDGCMLRVENYAGPVPINHKFAVVNAMMADVSVRMEEEDPEE